MMTVKFSIIDIHVKVIVNLTSQHSMIKVTLLAQLRIQGSGIENLISQ